MASARTALERVGARVPVPQPAFDRLMRRRARRQRNRRVATVAFALLLAIAAIGGALRVLGGAVRQMPANPGLDPSFGRHGVVTTSLSSGKDAAHAIAIEPDGSVVLAGSIASDSGFAIVRYTADGHLDTSFGHDGIVTGPTPTTDAAYGVAIQDDGKIVAAGSAGSLSTFALVRYNADGSFDRSFGRGGLVTTDVTPGRADFARTVAIQPDGKIVAAGRSNNAGASDFVIVRYDPDGSLDRTFGDGGIVRTNFHSQDDAWDVTLLRDGKILAVGFGAQSFALARYRSDGSLDPTFGTGGQVSGDIPGAAFGVTVEPDGTILTVGTTNGDFALAAFRPDGMLDRAFGRRGVASFRGIPWGPATRIATEPDGSIVAVGGPNIGAATTKSPTFTVAHFAADGSLDPSFASGGISRVDFGPPFTSSQANAVAVGPDGAVYAAGFAARAHGQSDFAVVRYRPA